MAVVYDYFPHYEYSLVLHFLSETMAASLDFCSLCFSSLALRDISDADVYVVLFHVKMHSQEISW